MVDPDFVQQEFQRHLKEIHLRGMGLSVDVYSPDLFELVNKLRPVDHSAGRASVSIFSAGCRRDGHPTQ
jgi:hypothetical protein